MTPTDDQIRGYLLGTLPRAAAGEVAAWAEEAPEAPEAFRRLDDRDPLADALRGSLGTPFPNGEETAVHLAIPASTLDATPLPVPIGYRFVRELGRGGMGTVFEASDETLKRRVAVKVMRPEIAAHPTAKSRFLREAESMAAVESDYIVPVLHVGETADGHPYLVMPLLAGETLDARLKRGPLAPAELVAVGRDAALGLAAAHARGLIHRDIKPSNLWLEANADGSFRRARILDFGLARPAHTETQMTTTGTIIGTPAYMSPEQARGNKVDARSDLFSLGSVLYRAATGKPPFPGDTTSAVLTALAVDDPIPVRRIESSVPIPLAALIHELLRKSPGERPTTDDVVRRLGASPNKPRRRLGWAALAGSLAALLLAAGIIIVVRNKDGDVTGTITVPQGGTATARDKDTGKEQQLQPGAPAKVDPKAETPVDPPKVNPNPLVVVEAGKPLSAKALTSTPAPLEGITSWTIETRRHRDSVAAVALTPDGKLLATGGVDGTVRVYDAATLELLKAFVGTDSPVKQMAWAPKGDLLLVHSADSVQPWDYPSGLRRLRPITVEDDGDHPFALAIAPDGTRYSIVGKIYTIASGEKFEPKAKAGGNFAWRPDGKMVAAYGPTYNRVEKIRLEDGDTEEHRLDGRLSLGAAWSPEGKTLAVSWPSSSMTQGAIILYTGDEQRTFEGNASALVYTPDGRHLVLFGQGCHYVDLSKKDAKPVAFGPPTISGGRAGAVAKDRCAVADGLTVTSFDGAFKKLKALEPSARFRFKPTGHYRVANSADADEIVYVVLTGKGQETLTPAEFAKRTGWKNDPATGFDGGK